MVSREEVSEFFDRMDRDFDGKLSFEEFMGEETPLERLFRTMDVDGDGSVTKEVSQIKEHIKIHEQVGWIWKPIFIAVCLNIQIICCWNTE